MEIETNMYLKKQAEENMAKLEDTTERLSNISQPNRPPREVDARIRYLLTKLTSVQKSIEQYDAAIKSAKEAVSKSWVEDED
jgi:prefoldin subunit 5